MVDVDVEEGRDHLGGCHLSDCSGLRLSMSGQRVHSSL